MHIDELIRPEPAEGAPDLHLKVECLPLLYINSGPVFQGNTIVITAETIPELFPGAATEKQQTIFTSELEVDSISYSVIYIIREEVITWNAIPEKIMDIHNGHYANN